MELTIKSNKLYPSEQSVSVDNNILTLIGENGCGKSSILESVFEQYLDDNDVNLICFSSGQNESFSDLYSKYINTSRKIRFEARADKLKIDFINSYYFDYHWSKILIFFATALKKEGYTRKFLKDKYIEIDKYNDDISTQLSFSVKVENIYIDRINESLEIEAKHPNEPTLRKTEFHNLLSSLIEGKINEDYDFTNRLSKSKVQIKANEVISIFKRDISKIFTFFSVATSDDYFINLSETQLELIKGLKLKDLSDGEYQLLSIYAIMDLFDTDNSVFLLDEIDTHIHYTLIKKVWGILKNAQGKIITTSHLADSILENDFDSIKFIKDGIVEPNLPLLQLAKRVSCVLGKDDYQLDLAARASNIALVDDEVDYHIFKKLAYKKIGVQAKDVLERVIPFKMSSGYNNPNVHLGKSKLQFAEKFITKFKDVDIETKNLFLICDKDNFSRSLIGADLTVSISKEFDVVKKYKKVKSHLLCWKRNEIENYLLSTTMLEGIGELENFKSQLPYDNIKKGDCLDRYIEISEYETKNLLHPYYKPKPDGYNEDLLNQIIDLIPTSEISEDIVNMYNFIASKVN